MCCVYVVVAELLLLLFMMGYVNPSVDGLYLTMVKQTEHMTRGSESGLFGYMAGLSDLFYIGSAQSNLLVH